jgi:sec-independent protein translocase protein TatB
MLDFSVGELLVIGAVSLVALGPERLPKVARTVGQWVGKAQIYVNQVRADIDREVQLSEIRTLTAQAREAAATVEQSVRTAVDGARAEATRVATEVMARGEGASWSGDEDPLPTFRRRYRPRPTIDDLTRELERLRRGVAIPGGSETPRSKYAPRARVSRVRVRR